MMQFPNQRHPLIMSLNPEKKRAVMELERQRATTVTQAVIAKESAQQRADAELYAQQKTAEGKRRVLLIGCSRTRRRIRGRSNSRLMLVSVLFLFNRIVLCSAL
jgi:hypothetical protein